MDVFLFATQPYCDSARLSSSNLDQRGVHDDSSGLLNCWRFGGLWNWHSQAIDVKLGTGWGCGGTLLTRVTVALKGKSVSTHLHCGVGSSAALVLRCGLCLPVPTLPVSSTCIRLADEFTTFFKYLLNASQSRKPQGCRALWERWSSGFHDNILALISVCVGTEARSGVQIGSCYEGLRRKVDWGSRIALTLPFWILTPRGRQS